jgi:hypothetical protein
MLRRTLPAFLLLTATVIVTGAALRGANQPPVVAHEWGTFTTVAGEDGQAIDWLPLGGPTDLPCFVQCFNNRLAKILPGYEQDAPLDYDTARSSLVAKVRMETPVIYFYADAPTTLDVRVRFPRGLITEWYPAANVGQPTVFPRILDHPDITGGIDWPMVHVMPDLKTTFPTGEGSSHYYAARETDAAPLRVNGQDEKFLFYRGVASFPVPISAALRDGAVQLTNLGREPVPGIILFENRAGRISFTDATTLETSLTVARPTRAADLQTLRARLADVLVTHGLFEREARAMVETWRDSWFEEGTRVFYVVPSAAVDRILPLSISPAPAGVARVFVGRMELITPEALVIVQSALAANDTATLERYGRFLGPIADRLASRLSSVSDRSRVRAVLNGVFARYVARFASCR